MRSHYLQIFTTLVCCFINYCIAFANPNPIPVYEMPSKNEEPIETPTPTPTTVDSLDLKESSKVSIEKSNYFPTNFDELKFMPGFGREASGYYSLMRLEAGFANSNYSSWTIGADVQFKGRGSLSLEYTWRIFERGWFPFFDLGAQLGLNPKQAIANLLDKNNLYLYGSVGLEKFITSKNKLIFQLTLGASLESAFTTLSVGYTFPL